MFPSADPSTTGLLSSGLGRFAGTAKAAAAKRNEDRLQDEIDHFRDTHPQMTPADRDDLDDLVLQRESARNTKLRRFVSTIPNTVIPSTGGSFASFFERRSLDNDYKLAQNTLHDARQEAQSDRDEDSVLHLRNARDDVEQADQRRDAATYDLLGTSFNGAGKLGPIFRKRASQTKIDIGYRTLRAARQDFAENPSQENRENLQLADLFVRASEQEDDANKGDLVVSSLIPGANKFLGYIASGKNFQDESRLWLRYNRLKRQILLRKRAEALQGANPVADRMLGLSMYGPAAGPAGAGTAAGFRGPSTAATGGSSNQ
jgi:hypothetical protein